MTKLNKKAFGGLLGLAVVMAALLFIPAWTLDYWQAWAFLAVFFVSALAITLFVTKKDPKLLERRVYAGPTAEKERSQKIIQFITSIGFIAMLVVPALIWRIFDEERLLAKNLPGYSEYLDKVKDRLVPFIW